KAVGEIARGHRRAPQRHGPELRAAGDAEHEREQATVVRHGAGVAVVRAGEQRLGGPARVCRPAIEIEEGALARVNQLTTVGRPLGAEITSAFGRPPPTALAPYLAHPYVP